MNNDKVMDEKHIVNCSCTRCAMEKNIEFLISNYDKILIKQHNENVKHFAGECTKNDTCSMCYNRRKQLEEIIESFSFQNKLYR